MPPERIVNRGVGRRPPGLGRRACELTRMTLPVQPPVAPMLAKLARELPRDAGLFYEPKWDGFRCIVFRDGDDVELGSRNEKPLTRYFPELVDALAPRAPGALRARRRDRDRRSAAAWSSTRCPSASIRPRSASASSPSRRPPRSSPSTCWPRATAPTWTRRTRSGAPRSRRRSRRRARPIHLTPVTNDPDVAADWFSRFEGAGLDGVVVKDGAADLPARQAGHAQGQAPAHGGLRGGGIPHPQGRRRRGLAAAGPLRRRPGRCTTSAWPRASAWPAGASWSPSSSPTGRTP